MFMRHDSFICVTWLIHMCDMTHPYVCDLTYAYVCDLTHVYLWGMTHPYVYHDSFIFMRHDSFICVTWLIHIYEAWLIHKGNMTHLHVWPDLFVCVTWLIHMCDMTISHVWHDSLIRETSLIHVQIVGTLVAKSISGSLMNAQVCCVLVHSVAVCCRLSSDIHAILCSGVHQTFQKYTLDTMQLLRLVGSIKS